VQRKVFHEMKELPTTWAKLSALDDARIERRVDAANESARAIDATLDDATLAAAWTKLLKGATEYDLADTDALGAALVARCAAAAKSSAGLKKRNAAAQQVVAPLIEGEFRFQGGARAKVLPKEPAEHAYDYQGEEWQSQRHLSTVLFDRFGGEECRARSRRTTRA